MRRSTWLVAAFLGVAFLSQRVNAAPLDMVVAQDPARTTVLLKWEVMTGSAQDPGSQSGLAYFVARSLWSGTRTRSRVDLEQALQLMQTQVTVSPETQKVVQEVEVPAAFFESFLFLLRDVLTQPAFDPVEVDRLRALIRKQIREDGGENPALGTDSGVRRISASDLRVYHQKFYLSSNLRLEVLAPWDPATVTESILRNLDTLP